MLVKCDHRLYYHTSYDSAHPLVLINSPTGKHINRDLLSLEECVFRLFVGVWNRFRILVKFSVALRASVCFLRAKRWLVRALRESFSRDICKGGTPWCLRARPGDEGILCMMLLLFFGQRVWHVRPTQHHHTVQHRPSWTQLTSWPVLNHSADISLVVSACVCVCAAWNWLIIKLGVCTCGRFFS